MASSTALILLLIAAAAAAASASAYTTVVTTRVREDMCEREMEEMMPMEHCMMYMQRQMKRDEFLRSAVAARRPMREEEHLEACCAELGQMRSMCRCEAVKEMMMDMPQVEMQRMACSLPGRCGMDPCACPQY